MQEAVEFPLNPYTTEMHSTATPDSHYYLASNVAKRTRVSAHPSLTAGLRNTFSFWQIAGEHTLKRGAELCTAMLLR